MVPINDRAGMANHLKMDLMISLHAAVAPYCSDHKAAVYFHEDERLVYPTRISAPNQTGESEIHHSAWAKLQIRHRDRSRQLAALIKQFLLAGGVFDQTTVDGAPLAVLMGADLPAVLIEVGCMRRTGAISISKMDQQISTYAQSIANAVNLAVNELQP